MAQQTLTQTQQSLSSAALPGTWKLGAGRAITLAPREDAVLRVAHGRMWVTFEGAHGLSPADSGDHFLDVGQQLTVQAGQRVVLEAAGARHGIAFQWQEYPWSCDWYKEHGRMCPEDAPEILKKFDAIYFGAVGNPAIVADHISAWGLLINFRRWFDLYVNLRPVRLFEGVPSPLVGRKHGDIDYLVIRENTEGEYGGIGGRMFEGTEREMVTQQSVFTRKGVDRIMKFAFELAKKRGPKPGKDKHQAVGYLDNGTMIVVNQAAALLGQTVQVVVCGAHTTSAGRLIFAELKAKA